MILNFDLLNEEPAFFIKNFGLIDFTLGLSMYEPESMRRLHSLFLMIPYQSFGYSAEEFDDEGRGTVIAFRPSGDKKNSLMTVEQHSGQMGSPNKVSRDILVNKIETANLYKAAFKEFLSSHFEDKLGELDKTNDLAVEYFYQLSK